jgi:hypothetical protein
MKDHFNHEEHKEHEGSTFFFNSCHPVRHSGPPEWKGIFQVVDTALAINQEDSYRITKL